VWSHIALRQLAGALKAARYTGRAAEDSNKIKKSSDNLSKEYFRGIMSSRR